MPDAEQPERKNKEEEEDGRRASMEQLMAEMLREQVAPSAAAASAAKSAAAAATSASAALESAAPTAYGSDMTDRINERLAKLEGAFEHVFEGIRHGQNITLAAVVGIGAILAALMIYMLQRIDNLPNEFNSITQTLSAAITAAKQQPPQVILIPAPATAPPAVGQGTEPKNP